MSDLWNIWVWCLVSSFLLFISWLLYSNYVASHQGKDNHRLDETHDGIGESYAPIPTWWAAAMWFTIVFSVFYLVLYPGMGNYQGILNWTSESELQKDTQKNQTVSSPVLNQYMATDIAVLSKDAEAMNLAMRIFQNNCAACHGKKAKSQKYFPNLTDNDWLYGSDPESIKNTILNGKQATMPAWKDVLTTEQITQVARFIQGQKTNQGEATYSSYCSACHGGQREGNTAMGAPNLSDNVWLYGGTLGEIIHSVRHGRTGHMPAHKHLLNDQKIHLLTAYVLSLSEKNEQ